MTCDTAKNLPPTAKQAQAEALKRLNESLALGTVTVVVGSAGSVSFRGWRDNAGMADMCAFRALTASSSPELRRAVMRAEAMSGRKVNAQAVAAGVHSHDGGHSWHEGH